MRIEKVTKYMKLEELIEHIRTNKIVDRRYRSMNGSEIVVDKNGKLFTANIHTMHDFPIEVEEEVKEDEPKYDSLVMIDKFGHTHVYKNKPISEIKGGNTQTIYSVVGSKLELVYEKPKQTRRNFIIEDDFDDYLEVTLIGSEQAIDNHIEKHGLDTIVQYGQCEHCGKIDSFENNEYLKTYGACNPDCYERAYV